MTKKNTKKALLFSVLSLVVCFSMLVGTTFAWFTDSVTSANNVIASGNLDVVLEYWDGDSWEDVAGADEIFNPAAKWEPGYADVAYFRITNAGSLSMQYSFVMNVVNPGKGTNVYGEEFELADYLQYSIVEDATEDAYLADRAAAIEAATAAGQVPRALGNNTAERVTNGTTPMASGESVQFAVVVWMPETVGNEANYRGAAPKIELTFNVIATQATGESDGFGSDYDDGLSVDSYAVGVAYFDNANEAGAEAIAINGAGYNVASIVVPKDAADSEKVTLRVEKTDYEGNITVDPGYAKETFDMTVEGLVDDNTTPIKAGVRIEAGLDPDTVALYHYDTAIEFTYNPETGWVTFETTTFSPFTVTYDPDSVYEAPSVGGVETPKADVTYAAEFVNTTIEWGNYGQWSPTEGLDTNLEAAFTFACPTNVDDAAFATWYCDFYVSLDKDLGANQIFLGGNYGDFGWVGFHNGDYTLEAGEELGLLESVTTNPWTYADIKEFVGTFTCGVGDVNNALEGATFTVALRLTNPENASEFYNVNVVTYTFGGNYEIK